MNPNDMTITVIYTNDSKKVINIPGQGIGVLADPIEINIISIDKTDTILYINTENVEFEVGKLYYLKFPHPSTLLEFYNYYNSEEITDENLSGLKCIINNTITLTNSETLLRYNINGIRLIYSIDNIISYGNWINIGGEKNNE